MKPAKNIETMHNTTVVGVYNDSYETSFTKNTFINKQISWQKGSTTNRFSPMFVISFRSVQNWDLRKTSFENMFWKLTSENLQ